METIDDLFQAANPHSARLFDTQRRVVAGAYTHLARQLSPFPLFIQENVGARKHDIDGHEYIDYWLGHGAMLLGHAHPAVTEAISEQARRGLHAGGETELGAQWASLIQEMVPSADKVRFFSSGGEATQMAIRVARAYTGKDRIIKFDPSFHGWHDAAAIGGAADVPLPPGVPRVVGETVTVLPLNDLAALDRALVADGDVAAVLVEPGGAFSDTVLSDPKFLRGMRQLTTERGVVLIFDEVVTGFRYARGGAQEFFDVIPDLTTLGKIIGGGLPAGALVGSDQIMELFEWRPDEQWERHRMIAHTGTWNAQPVLAAAGTATLRLVRDTDAVARAAALTQRLIAGFNAVFADCEVKAFAYGRSSIFKVCPGEPPPMVAGDFSTAAADGAQLSAGWGPLGQVLRKAMILEGVDLMRTNGFLSAAHTDDDIEMTCQALSRALGRMRREGSL